MFLTLIIEWLVAGYSKAHLWFHLFLVRRFDASNGSFCCDGYKNCPNPVTGYILNPSWPLNKFVTWYCDSCADEFASLTFNRVRRRTRPAIDDQSPTDLEN
jgi:hypothetical protein